MYVYICTLCNYNECIRKSFTYYPLIESSYPIHLQAWLSFNAAHNPSPRSSECRLEISSLLEFPLSTFSIFSPSKLIFKWLFFKTLSINFYLVLF